MVKIAVCFKIVPDYEEIPVLDWQKGEIPDTTYCKKMYSCFDEAALEMGLRLKDMLTEKGETVRITAVTTGPRQATLLTGLYAAGYDRVVCIEGVDGAGDPAGTARELAAYFIEEPADLILTGRQAGGWDSGTVPAYLAAALSMPWLPEVVCLVPGETEKFTFVADCESETEWESVLIHAPAVLSVGNADVSYLRMFSLKARLEARKKEIVSRTAKPAPEGAPHIVYVPRKKETSCTMMEGTIEEQARALQGLVREGRDG